MFNNRILAIGLALWAAQYLFAHLTHTLTPAQMRASFPDQSILPLVWHGGIWFDLPLTFYLAYVTKQHPEWAAWQWAITLVVGFACSWFMHYKVYAPATLPNADPRAIVTQEAHVQDGEVTFVGLIHLIFFGIMLAIILNEALFSNRPSLPELAALSVFLVGLLFVGNHMPLGLIKLLTGGDPADYHGKPLESIVGWASVFGGAGVAACICIARDAFQVW